jgi:hypothetical protein
MFKGILGIVAVSTLLSVASGGSGNGLHGSEDDEGQQ